jgi:Protein of unknown function (DUF3175)
MLSSKNRHPDNALVASRDRSTEYRIAKVGEVLPAGGRGSHARHRLHLYGHLPADGGCRPCMGWAKGSYRPRFLSYAIPVVATFVAAQAPLTAKTVETKDERDTAMFRIRIRIDPEDHIFQARDPKRIAMSVKRSAPGSGGARRTSATPAMSMLTFYINRAGRNLSPPRRQILETAKSEPRRLFGRAES